MTDMSEIFIILRKINTLVSECICTAIEHIRTVLNDEVKLKKKLTSVSLTATQLFEDHKIL